MPFTEAVNQTAYLKAGFLGFQGSGKTYTAVRLMIGLHQHCNSKMPIFMIDSETGSDWAIPMMKAAGIPFQVDKTRAFKGLVEDMQLAEESAFGLIIDSVSHFWAELIDGYKKGHKLGDRIAIHHWMPIKAEWARFSMPFVNSNLHICVCGRAGWDWGQDEDEEGHKELVKKGTKMKAEGEFGFEPSLLIEMERERKSQVGAEILHLGHVLKDRRMDAGTLDGKTFEWTREDPEDRIFKDLFPHIEWLNLGGEHLGVKDESSADMFQPKGESYGRVRERAKIQVEELEGMLSMHFPSNSKEDRMAKAAIKKHLFSTYSDTEIEKKTAEELSGAISKLADILADPEGQAVRSIIEEQTAKGK